MKVLNQDQGLNWMLYNGDCVEVVKSLPDNSIHYTIFSPPFASLFTYSDLPEDMGNCKTDAEFYEHFGYLVPELYRLTMPGRLLSFHCMNMPYTIVKDGFIGIKDFRGDMIRLFQSAGFIFHSEVLIWKDPLLQAVRTKIITLAHKQLVKDSAMSGIGLPDYIITMRKPGKNPEPIAHGRGLETYIGTRDEPAAPKNDEPGVNKYSHEVWQRYASPVWFDINQSNTLNIQQAREAKDERHICPLQLDVIARCLELWSNKNDIILSPFAGIGSEGYKAILMKRRFIGIELKKTYYDQAIKYLKIAEESKQSEMNLALDE
jgi:hypothetical protein